MCGNEPLCVRIKSNRTKSNRELIRGLIRDFQKITVCRKRCQLLFVVKLGKNLKTRVSKSYFYYSLTKTLAENDFDNSVELMTKYFWQNWIINRRVDQLLAKNECPKELRNKPLVEQFSDFVLNARMSISKASPNTQWQKNQIKKLFYILKIIQDSIKQFKSGTLSHYNKEILLTLRNSLKQIKSNKTMNFRLILEIIKDLVINGDPKLNETKIIVSKKIL
jgi:hypothetical protein